MKYLRLGGQIDRESLNNLEEKTFLKEGPFKSGIITTRKDT